MDGDIRRGGLKYVEWLQNEITRYTTPLIATAMASGDRTHGRFIDARTWMQDDVVAADRCQGADQPVLKAQSRAGGERRSTQRLFEQLRGRGHDGAHDSVHRFVKAWRDERARVPAHAFVPLSFAPGEAYQFDWSHETIPLAGPPLMIKVAHMTLSHSRMPFVRAYFRETQELVFDAHDKAFLFYGGLCRRGIYDSEADKQSIQ